MIEMHWFQYSPCNAGHELFVDIEQIGNSITIEPNVIRDDSLTGHIDDLEERLDHLCNIFITLLWSVDGHPFQWVGIALTCE